MKIKKLTVSLCMFLSLVALAEKNLKVHYQRTENENWNLWIWPENSAGKVYEFTEKDKFGDIANIKLNDDVKKVGIIVRTDDWKKDFDQDRFIELKGKETEVYLLGGEEKIFDENPDERPKEFNKLEAVIYFHNEDNNYDNLKLRVDNKEYKLRKNRKFGSSIFIRKEGKDLKNIKFNIIQDEKEIYENTITKFNNDGYAKVYVNDDDKTVYYDIDMAKEAKKIENASINTLNSIDVITNKPFNLSKLSSSIKVNDMSIKDIKVLDGTSDNTNHIEIFFNENFEFNKKYMLHIDKFKDTTVNIGRVVATKEFDEMFYTDIPLGNIYSKDKTIFRVWAPTANFVNLVTYKNGVETKYRMNLIDKGVYEYTLLKDNKDLEYMYEVHFNDKINLAQDPYAIASTVNSTHSVVVDVKELESNFVKQDTPIIYELSIRDMTSFKDTNVINKGKFLGLIEENRKSSNGMKVGLDYIKDLGVTYVQVMPMYDFSTDSVDELNQFSRYNWGYDPVNYNVIEGSFSVNPKNPTSRMYELQKFVDTMHKNNIGVIMDVVYNHVYSANAHSFNQIVPNYYFRLDKNGKYTNGTGVGNDVASEHKMVSRYIVDSTKYLMQMYKLDGFRFDLMGIIDINTMEKVYNELSKINKNVIILGEGWNMGTLPDKLKTIQDNANIVPEIRFFSDDMRDTVKGSTFGQIGTGFVNGKKNVEKYLVDNIKGKVRTYTKPSQAVQYVEAHDNLTLYDQLKVTNPNDSEDIIEKRHKLATTIILLSNGTPFIHAGQEFLRTKDKDENSYKSSDKINRIDYDRAKKYEKDIEYVKELIEIRKENQIFNLKDFDTIEKNMEIIKSSNGIIEYKLKDSKTYYVVYNANEKDMEVEIDNGKYTVLVSNYLANSKGLKEINITNGKIKVDKLSALVIESK